MAVISWTRVSTYPDDAWSLAISPDRVELFPVRCERFYGAHPCGCIQHCYSLDGLVLAALSRYMGCHCSGTDDGYFAVHALLRALRAGRCIRGLLWGGATVRNLEIFRHRSA